MPFSFDKERPFFKLAYEGKLEEVEDLMASGDFWASAKASDGRPLLFFPIKSGKLQMVKWLIEEAEADMFALDPFGYTALLHAADCGSDEMLEYLIKKTKEKQSIGGAKAQIRLKTKSGMTAFLLAARSGSIEKMDRLIKERQTSIRDADPEDNTALLFAAFFGHLQAVKWLKQHGAEMGEKNKEGVTALMLAAKNGRINVVKWLIETGQVNINEQDHQGRTALMHAIRNGRNKIVEYLAERKDIDLKDIDLLKAVKWLKQHGAEMGKNKEGMTALMVAAIKGHINVVKWLIETGQVNINEQDHQGRTALMHAIQNGQSEIVEYLAERKDINLLQKEKMRNMTALHLAAYLGHTRMVEVLFKKMKPETDKKDNSRFTPFMWAADQGKFETMQWFLENGVDIDEKDGEGNTALINAMLTDNINIELVQFLIQKGAKLSEANKRGDTALSIAVEKDEIEIVKLLLKESRLSSFEILSVYQTSKNEELRQAFKEKAEAIQKTLDEFLEDKNIVPSEGQCPITTGLIIEPVIGPDGYTYERAAIENWLEQHPNSPQTRQSMEISQLIPNRFAKKYLEEKIFVPFEQKQTTAQSSFVASEEKEVKTKEIPPFASLASTQNLNDELRLIMEPKTLNQSSLVNELPVFKFALEGNLKKLKELISSGNVSSSIKDSHGTPLLFFAIESGNLEIMRWLIEEGKANLTDTDSYGNTTVIIDDGHTQMVEWIVKQAPANLPATNNEKVSPLMFATALNQTAMVRWLIKEGKVKVDEIDWQGKTALFVAAHTGNLPIVQYLIQVGHANPSLGNSGLTPLYAAALGNHVDIVNFLLEQPQLPYRDILSVYHSVVINSQNETLKKVFKEYMDKVENLVTIPEYYRCPLTKQLMQDPVIAQDGYTYEKAAITRWLKEKNSVSPMTDFPINKYISYPNRFARARFEEVFKQIDQARDKYCSQKQKQWTPIIFKSYPDDKDSAQQKDYKTEPPSMH